MAFCICAPLRADDWPQWRGLHRDGIWREAGILESIPPEGLKVLWRVPVGVGFSSPVVAEEKVYVTDSHVTRTNASENVRCLDAGTGKIIWTNSYPVVYPEYGADPDHPFGPVATPVIAGGKIYTYGRMAHLLCLDVINGKVLWSRHLPKDYGTTEDLRGPNSSPILESNLVIVFIARNPQISVAAFEKDSGHPVWESLDEIPSNTSPIVIDAAGRRQLIVWAYKSVAALDPTNGHILWRQELPTPGNYAVPTPVVHDDFLLLSGLMMKLNRHKPGASILWPDELRPVRIYLSDTSTPLIQDGLVFMPNAKAEIACLNATTGKQLWKAENVSEAKGGPSIHITGLPYSHSAFLFTDRGDLVLARLTAERYEERGRFHLLEPTSEYGPRKMAWVPPAYSGKRIFARNDKELVCASLAAAANPQTK